MTLFNGGHVCSESQSASNQARVNGSSNHDPLVCGVLCLRVTLRFVLCVMLCVGVHVMSAVVSVVLVWLWCVCGVACVVCVDSKRRRMYLHRAHVMKHMCAWSPYARRRFERTHGLLPLSHFPTQKPIHFDAFFCFTELDANSVESDQFPERNAHLFMRVLCDCSVSTVSWDEDDDNMNSCGTNFVVFIH